MALDYSYAYSTHKDLDKTIFSLYKQNSEGNWVAIDVARNFEIHGTILPAKFDTTLTTEPDIPEMFQEALVMYAVSRGYKKPPNLQPEVAMMFDADFERLKKEYKKWMRNNATKMGTIVPQDF